MFKLFNFPGIYKITNMQNGKIYIGSAKCLRKRLEEHVRALKRNGHDNARLQNSWNKYGMDAFEFSVLEAVQDLSSLVAREQFYIDSFNSASRNNFNISPTAGNCLGVKKSIEERARMSVARVGRKHSPETIAKIAAATLGKKRSQESRDAMSNAKKGTKMSDSTKSAIALANTGSKQSAETKAKRSAAMKGRAFSPEHRAALSLAKKGNTSTRGMQYHTPESKANLSSKMTAIAKERGYVNRLRKNQSAQHPPEQVTP